MKPSEAIMTALKEIELFTSTSSDKALRGAIERLGKQLREEHPSDDELLFQNCQQVPCACVGCSGTFKGIGRNKQDNLTFLECNECGCAWVAYDTEKGLPYGP